MRLIAVLLPLAAMIACDSGDKLSPVARRILNHSAAILNELLRTEQNPIPDALLNRTRCIAIVEAPARGEGTGVVSCRYSDNGWTAPAFVTFLRGPGSREQTPQQLLILLTSDRSVQEMMRSDLHLGRRPSSSPGLLVRQSPTVTDAELAADDFEYEHAGHGLRGALASGTLRADDITTQAFYGRKFDFRSALNDRNTRSAGVSDYAIAVASFFNAITPVGIIIHHSATLPGTEKVPVNERDIDVFHRQRGFDVVCFGKTYHVAYHYLVNPDGKVIPGRPDHCEGAHARGYNAYLGISVLGDFSSVDNPTGSKGLTRPTPAQMKSLEVACQRLMHKYHIPVQRILRHSDVARTRCPGDRFPFARLLMNLERTP